MGVKLYGSNLLDSPDPCEVIEYYMDTIIIEFESNCEILISFQR